MDKNKVYKLIEYFKFLATVHLAVIGVVVTFKEKFLSGTHLEIIFWVTAVILFFSFMVVIYGYSALINSHFETVDNHLRIAKFARKWPGYILIASLASYIIQVFMV